MRRIQNRINRNKDKMPKHLPTHPDVLMNSIWLNDVIEHRETIQVLSPKYSTTPEDTPRPTQSFHLDTLYPEASGDSNSNAKVKKQLDEQFRNVNGDHSYGDHDPSVTDYVYSQYFDENHTRKDDSCFRNDRNNNSNVSLNNQYDDVEVIQRDDLTDWNSACEGNLTSFEQECDDASRVIWIYSYTDKDKERSEQEYELDRNVPNTSASYLHDNAEFKYDYDSGKGSRVGTPVPSDYVPRLDFSKDFALPTVTEIGENSSESQKSTKQEVMSRKSFNSWFSEFEKSDSKSNAESETKKRERTCALSDQNVGTIQVFKDDAQTQTVNKCNPLQSFIDDRREINTKTIGTQTELIIHNVDAKILSETVASNQTFVIAAIHNYSSKPVRSHSAPVSKNKCSPWSGKNSYESSNRKAMEKSRHKILKDYDDVSKTRKCLIWQNETPYRVPALGSCRSQGSQTCSCIKNPRKLAVNVPPYMYESSPVLESLRSLAFSLGDDLEYENMSWWQRCIRCMLCR